MISGDLDDSTRIIAGSEKAGVCEEELLASDKYESKRKKESSKMTTQTIRWISLLRLISESGVDSRPSNLTKSKNERFEYVFVRWMICRESRVDRSWLTSPLFLSLSRIVGCKEFRFTQLRLDIIRYIIR